MEKDATEELIKEMKDKLETGETINTILKTDERVLARITDGIYRQPASALRELISNSYDADASSVVIQTDAPRFDKITVKDDGNGISPEALAILIRHIGGSPKRTYSGAEIGVVNEKDCLLSPGGRKLIGKIGIGLFSIAQLSQRFKIITKTKGSSYRIVVDVILKTFSEDKLSGKKSTKTEFETGDVQIRFIDAPDKDAHGTEIIITHLHPRTQNELRSQLLWQQLDFDAEVPENASRKPPAYHIGRLDESSKYLINPQLPWLETDDPEVRFKKMLDAVVNNYKEENANPTLENIFDNYLRTIWQLSLSIPLNYVEKHPFDITHEDGIDAYSFGDKMKGQASKTDIQKGKTLRQAKGLISPIEGKQSEFEVLFDGIKLFRPIRLNNRLTTDQAMKNPLLFIGKYDKDLSQFNERIRGGQRLSFEAYFLWTPIVVPVEHRGVLIRINNSSGSLFDETFMKYLVSEQTRLRQITAEIFVNEGLDAALNIDRESFNYAHPHYQILTKWVHSALRMLTNTHKRLGSEIRTERMKEVSKKTIDKYEKRTAGVLKEIRKDDEFEIPEVVITDNLEAVKERQQGKLIFDKKVVFSSIKPCRVKSKAAIEQKEIESKTKALIQVLYAFDVFDKMPYKKRDELVRRILEIFEEPE